MSARYRVGAASYDNPYSTGRTQIFSDEEQAHVDSAPTGYEQVDPEPERVHASWPKKPPEEDFIEPDPDWSDAQFEVYFELLEVMPASEAWQAAADLLEHPSDKVVAERPADWSFAITAVVVGAGLFHFARNTRRRKS